MKDNLFAFVIGGNDLWLGLPNIQWTDEQMDKITESVFSGVESIIKFGGKHFIIVSPASLYLTPSVRILGID